MKRSVQIVLLCEDTQHEAFARRFLAETGWSKRPLRVKKAPRGRGSAAGFVRAHFPGELAAYRRKRGSGEQALLVVLDGDHRGVRGRQTELDDACRKEGVDVRRGDDRVLVLVPTWNIETWIAYLDGVTVDEARNDYPRLPRARKCQSRVEALAAMCRDRTLRSPAPPSLESACTEYARLSGSGGGAAPARGRFESVLGFIRNFSKRKGL